MQLSQLPCEDFYNYVCGRWPEANPEHISEAEKLDTELSIQLAETLLNSSATFKRNQSAYEKAIALFRASGNTYSASIHRLFSLSPSMYMVGAAMELIFRAKLQILLVRPSDTTG